MHCKKGEEIRPYGMEGPRLHLLGAGSCRALRIQEDQEGYWSCLNSCVYVSVDCIVAMHGSYPHVFLTHWSFMPECNIMHLGTSITGQRFPSRVLTTNRRGAG